MIKTKIWEPYQLAEKFGKDNKKFKAGQFDVGENQSWKAKLSIFVRGNFFIPDARVFWVKPSVEFLEKYLKANHYDVLVTTGSTFFAFNWFRFKEENAQFKMDCRFS
jgi:hypothetical protein